MEIKRILLPFDNSIHSVNAANYTISLARQIGAKVTIVHCYEWMPSITEVPSPLIKDLDAVCKKKADDVLKTAEEIFRDRGVDYTLETILGSPGKVLVELAKGKQYDLIIMGSKGHSDIAGIFIGSVTHRLVNAMYCPVLVVP
jgi:nucleotide-binding universal stress UspA family protein